MARANEIAFLSQIFDDSPRAPDQWGWKVIYCGDLLITTNRTAYTVYRGGRKVSLQRFIRQYQGAE